MKRFIRLICLCFLGLIVLSGCDLPGQFVGKNPFAAGTSASGHHISAKESSAKKSSNQTKAVAYSDLSTKVTRNIHFTFKADQDETADSKAGAVYLITMTVVNGSSVPVVFDSSKFQIIAPDWSEKQRTAQSGTIRLQPGKKATINSLFTKVSRQSLSGSGIFVYLTWQHPLAYVYKCFESGGVSSDNLGDTKLIKLNTPKQADSASSSSSSDNNPSANTDDTDDDADDTSDTSSSGTVDMKNLTQAQLLDWVRADLTNNGWQLDSGKVDLKPAFEDGYAIVRVFAPMPSYPSIKKRVLIYRVNSDGKLESSIGDGNFNVVSTPYPDN
jgi:hypothetical protein